MIISQLSISMVQSCLSIGKYWRFIGHEAVTVNLRIYTKTAISTLFISLESKSSTGFSLASPKMRKRPKVFVAIIFQHLLSILSYLIDLRTSPSCEIRRNSFWVVAVWKYDFFSFTKKVSGTQSVLRNSEPTYNHKKSCTSRISLISYLITYPKRNLNVFSFNFLLIKWWSLVAL